jgi:hypothetical protein
MIYLFCTYIIRHIAPFKQQIFAKKVNFLGAIKETVFLFSKIDKIEPPSITANQPADLSVGLKTGNTTNTSSMITPKAFPWRNRQNRFNMTT